MEKKGAGSAGSTTPWRGVRLGNTVWTPEHTVSIAQYLTKHQEVLHSWIHTCLLARREECRTLVLRFNILDSMEGYPCGEQKVSGLYFFHVMEVARILGPGDICRNPDMPNIARGVLTSNRKKGNIGQFPLNHLTTEACEVFRLNVCLMWWGWKSPGLGHGGFKVPHSACDVQELVQLVRM